MQIFENFNTKNAKYVCDIDDEIELSNGQKYIADCQLGGGGESYVIQISEKVDDEQFKTFAMKIAKYPNKHVKNNKYIINKRFKKEIGIAKEFSLPEYKTNFITYNFDGNINLKTKSNTKNHSYYVMDIATGSIEDYLCNTLNWNDEQEILPRIKELTTTIKLLHDKNYVHRDIKPQNILVHGELFKLADFGMVEVENTTCEKHGPKYWPTPELLEMCNDDIHCSGKRTDVFMLGCILYFIYTKKYPIGNINIDLIDNKYKMKPIIKKMISYKQDERHKCGKEVLEEINTITFEDTFNLNSISSHPKITLATVNNRKKSVKRRK